VEGLLTIQRARDLLDTLLDDLGPTAALTDAVDILIGGNSGEEPVAATRSVRTLQDIGVHEKSLDLVNPHRYDPPGLVDVFS